MSETPSTYTPGYQRYKLMMIGYGFVLCLLGLSQIATPLRLIFFGQRARAEAVSVIKTKAGLPDQILTTDYQILEKQEPHDRSYLFWNEFQFHLPDGERIAVRCPVGSQIKPLYPLIDSDGLPTSDLIYYDPAHPQSITFPLIISTWFAPGVLLIAGFVAMIIGATLYYWASKPIELPHLPPRNP